MNTHIAGHVPLAGHEKFASAWKLWIAGVAIAALTVVGLYLTIAQWRRDGALTGLFVLGCFIGPAVAATFGYFWCMPEVLGGMCRDQDRMLLQKWSDYALLSSFIGIVVVEVAYLIVIQSLFHSISIPRAIAILVMCPWMLAACVVASSEYLSWTIPSAAGASRTGWRGRVRTALERWGSWLIKPLTTTVSLLTGGALVLLTLVLVVKGDIFGPEFKGYEVIAGKTTYYGFLFVLNWTERGIYSLGVLLALLALVGALPVGVRLRIRESGMLAALAGILALLEVTTVGLTTWPRHNVPVALSLLWLIVWAIPVVIWSVFRRKGNGGWNHTRVAIMVFYLPLFLLWLGFLPFVTYLAIGYGAYVGGVLLIWWGFVQGGRQRAAQSVSQIS
ncbi:MAG TPA: hypothetical protein VLW46_01175 [Candidatus Bathyarchaeia archaeon]|nr:hypothetical protein [Candidatus Bathyarchaeia archaeon]